MLATSFSIQVARRKSNKNQKCTLNKIRSNKKYFLDLLFKLSHKRKIKNETFLPYPTKNTMECRLSDCSKRDTFLETANQNALGGVP